jgi:hypothetical protein
MGIKTDGVDLSAVDFAPDGQGVAAGWYGGQVVVWTLDGEQVVGIKAKVGVVG